MQTDTNDNTTWTIQGLKAENDRLLAVIKDLRNRLERATIRLNNKIRDDYEMVDLGDR